MRIYLLHLASAERLTAASARVFESSQVESCTVEPETGRLRFHAPQRAGDAIVERIYAEGGLTWCSRHEPARSEPQPRRSELRLVPGGAT